MTILSEIKSGKLITDKQHISDWAATQKDGRYRIHISKWYKRPNQTMRYLYKIYAILAKELGYYPEDVKNMVKTKLLHYETIKDPEGNNTLRFWSTADYTPEMYNDAINLVMHWGAINGIQILTSEEFKEQFI